MLPPIAIDGFEGKSARAADATSRYTVRQPRATLCRLAARVNFPVCPNSPVLVVRRDPSRSLLTASAPVRRKHAGYVARELQRALQLRNALDLERERHPRLVMARLRVHRRHVDLFPGQQLGKVAQQPLTVGRLDDDVDRKKLLARRAPI